MTAALPGPRLVVASGSVTNPPSISPTLSPTLLEQPASQANHPTDQTDYNWKAYCSHIQEYFYQPDIQAVEIVLSAAASHFQPDTDPLWLFVLGPSGGDKTSLCINSLLSLSNVHLTGQITPKTFLSGYTGTSHPSLLHKISSGILAFKDFTTFMSERPEAQAEIASQLREIYDGVFVKDTGKGITIQWKGKLTVIAAATPALERAWATRRDLGERFLQVRISRKDGLQQSLYAQRQRGKEEFISSRMRNLATTFFQSSPPIPHSPPSLSESQLNRIAAMAELVAYARGTVPRHPITNAIIDLPQIENSGRMAKALASLVASHAALFRKPEISESDMVTARRVTINSIPITRGIIIDAIPLDASVSSTKLQAISGLSESTVNLLSDDLEALGLVKIIRGSISPNELFLTDLGRGLWNGAFS